MPEKHKTNPDIVKTTIGIKNLREIKIYPLSLHDEFEMLSVIKSIFSQLTDDTAQKSTSETTSKKKRRTTPAKNKEKSGFDFLEIITNEIKNRFSEIVTLVTDPEDNVTLKEITNNQFADLVRIIYDANFKDSSKKLKDLFKEVAPKMEEQGINGSGLKRSFQKFAETTEDIDTNTSSDSHTEEEVLQEDS